MSGEPFKETILGIIFFGVISSVIATLLLENRPRLRWPFKGTIVLGLGVITVVVMATFWLAPSRFAMSRGVITVVVMATFWRSRPKPTSLRELPASTVTNLDPSLEPKPRGTPVIISAQQKVENATEPASEAPRFSSGPYIPESPTWGYSFPSFSGIYTVRLVGFPDDIDDATVHSLLKTDLGARLEEGKPTSFITFHANVDPNWQSDQCIGTNGFVAVIDLESDEALRQIGSSIKQGRGFACLGSDRKITEIEALQHAFADMKH